MRVCLKIMSLVSRTFGVWWPLLFAVACVSDGNDLVGPQSGGPLGMLRGHQHARYARGPVVTEHPLAFFISGSYVNMATILFYAFGTLTHAPALSCLNSCTCSHLVAFIVFGMLTFSTATAKEGIHHLAMRGSSNDFRFARTFVRDHELPARRL